MVADFHRFCEVNMYAGINFPYLNLASATYSPQNVEQSNMLALTYFLVSFQGFDLNYLSMKFNSPYHGMLSFNKCYLKGNMCISMHLNNTCALAGKKSSLKEIINRYCTI